MLVKAVKFVFSTYTEYNYFAKNKVAEGPIYTWVPLFTECGVLLASINASTCLAIFTFEHFIRSSCSFVKPAVNIILPYVMRPQYINKLEGGGGRRASKKEHEGGGRGCPEQGG